MPSQQMPLQKHKQQNPPQHMIPSNLVIASIPFYSFSVTKCLAEHHITLPDLPVIEHWQICTIGAYSVNFLDSLISNGKYHERQQQPASAQTHLT